MALPHAHRYSLTGAALGLGAPLGLLALRWLRAGRPRDGWVGSELRSDALTYGYLAGATSTVFGLFGWALGARGDQLIASAREIGRLRDEFVAVVAHDLRGPVQSLRMQSELLLEQASGSGQVCTDLESVKRMHRAALALQRQVEDLLDAGRIDAQRVSILAQPLSLNELAEEVLARMRPALREHPLELEVIDEPRVCGDPVRLGQVLTNLLENAARYSEAGTPIRVRVEAAPGGATFTVIDRGWGIAPEEVPKLFDRFYQTGRARKKHTGLGLGLYIVKGLVDAHHGRITVDSTPGRGSAFRIWLPAP
jgi:signal transduction histidine kinase